MKKSALKSSMRMLLFSSLLFVVFFGATWKALNRTRRPQWFLIPWGVDVVNVRYGVPNAPPLSVEDGYYVLRIPRSGHLETSTTMDKSQAKDKFSSVSPKGELSALKTEAEISMFDISDPLYVVFDKFDGVSKRRFMIVNQHGYSMLAV